MSSAPAAAADLERRKSLRIRLRKDLDIDAHKYEGRTFYVVKDPVSLRYYRLKDNEHFLLKYLDGKHTLEDVQSGIGVVHNALLIDGVERTVVHGPFRPAPRSVFHGELSLSPKPPWFVDNKMAASTGKRLTEFAAAPGWLALPGIFASALRG